MVYDKEHSERLGILGTTFGKAKDIINLLVSINQMEYRTIALKKLLILSLIQKIILILKKF